MRQIGKTIFTCLSAAIVVVCGGTWLLFGMGHASWQALVIPTGSMRPAIPPNSLALVERVPVTTLHIGDVITYADLLNVHKTITHRVVKTFLLDGRILSFITKGDANQSVDPAVVGGAVKGKVVASIPYIGVAVLWARTWAGIAVLVYLPALLLMVPELKRLSAYYRRQLPYKLLGYKHSEGRDYSLRPLTVPVIGLAVVVVLAAVWAPAALAQLHTNTVSLVHNRIRVVHRHDDKHDIDIDDETDQDAESGNAMNDNGEGSVRSGDATNDHSTTATVTVSP